MAFYEIRLGIGIQEPQTIADVSFGHFLKSPHSQRPWDGSGIEQVIFAGMPFKVEFKGGGGLGNLAV